MKNKKTIRVNIDRNIHEVFKREQYMGECFESFVETACNHYIDRFSSGNSGYVYALSIDSLVKVGASSQPHTRISALARDNAIDSEKMYISNKSAFYYAWEAISHWNLFDLGFHSNNEMFTCDIDTATKIINKSKPRIERGIQYANSERKAAIAFSKYGLKVCDMEERTGMTRAMLTALVKDDYIFKQLCNYAER